MWIILFWFLW